MFGDTTCDVSPTTVAATFLPKAKCGSGFCASASASISANVCPVPANNFSACAGLNVAENIAPCSSVRAGCFAATASASAPTATRIPGCEAPLATRCQPKSIDFGVGIEIDPTAPASRTALANGEVRANDFKGPGSAAGPPL